MSRHCNFCILQALEKFADDTKRQLVLEPNPTQQFPEGVNVLIGGVWSAWLAKAPTACACAS